MKKLLLAVFCVWYSINAFAQKIHFTDTSNVWRVVQPVFNMPSPWLFNYYTFSFGSKILIDSVEYVNFGFGPIREDTVLKKVFLRSASTETVLIDYNLEVGDTFFTPLQNFVVISIDSTLINSVWHKVWNFPFYLGGWYSSGGPLSIIEGLGCVQGPLFMFGHYDYDGCVECAEPLLYCFSNKGYSPPLIPKVRWLNNTSSCVEYANLEVEQLASVEKGIVIYPNPATSKLMVSASDEIRTLAIYSLIGQPVYAREYSATQVQVDVTNLPKGVYLLKINGAEVKKFIKE